MGILTLRYFSFGLLVKLGLAVIISFAILFLPWIGSLDQMQQVIHRIFPVARGLYEDKVANIWCALNVVVKLRNLMSLQSTVRLRQVDLKE